MAFHAQASSARRARTTDTQSRHVDDTYGFSTVSTTRQVLQHSDPQHHQQQYHHQQHPQHSPHHHHHHFSTTDLYTPPTPTSTNATVAMEPCSALPLNALDLWLEHVTAPPSSASPSAPASSSAHLLHTTVPSPHVADSPRPLEAAPSAATTLADFIANSDVNLALHPRTSLDMAVHTPTAPPSQPQPSQPQPSQPQPSQPQPLTLQSTLQSFKHEAAALYDPPQGHAANDCSSLAHPPPPPPLTPPPLVFASAPIDTADVNPFATTTDPLDTHVSTPIETPSPSQSHNCVQSPPHRHQPHVPTHGKAPHLPSNDTTHESQNGIRDTTYTRHSPTGSNAPQRHPAAAAASIAVSSPPCVDTPPLHDPTVDVATLPPDANSSVPEEPLAVPTTGSSTAVERAKRTAEQITMHQLARRKRKAPSQSVVATTAGSTPDCENNVNGDNLVDEDDDEPERQSHRKYQKRLQKNRDSAFVSRIRRREYTRLLESSLASLEKEKEAAVTAFRDMKRRFDIVSAELTGIKAAFGRTSGHPPVAPAAVGAPPVVAGEQAQGNRPRAFATTMYMVALVVGVFLPDWARNTTLTTRFSRGAVDSASGDAGASEAAVAASETSGKHGYVWSALRSAGADGGRDDKGSGRTTYELETDLSKGGAQRLVEEVREDAITVLGKEKGDRMLELLTQHLQSLSGDEVADVQRVAEEDGRHKGFEALLRAVVLEEGGGSVNTRDIDGEAELDDIVAHMAGLDVNGVDDDDDDRLL